jgi:hypothetical protein
MSQRSALRITGVLGLLALVLAGVSQPVSTVAQAPEQRTVFLMGRLADEELIALSVALAAREPTPLLLLDTPGVGPYLKSFLAAYRPERIIPVGAFGDATGLERRLGLPVASSVEKVGSLWEVLYPQVRSVVVCPATPRSLLLQAGCLAGVTRSPLVVLREGEADQLRQRLTAWKAGEVFAVGNAAPSCRGLAGVQCTELATEEDVTAAYLRQLARQGPVETIVVANPADSATDSPALSRLAPALAVSRRAALVLTNPAGDNVAEVVARALKKTALRRAENLLLLAGLKAIPMERRQNPAPGKDDDIEMEPLTPKDSEPFTFAAGRLFHADPGVVALTLARQRLLTGARGPRKALIASNAGGGLPLMEMFSRHTAKELANRGYQTTALFEDSVNRDDVRRLLPEQDIFLWEGHYKTLVDTYEMPTWTEPLRPSLVFLQSCLALNEKEAQPLLQRGAVAVVGASTRTYSGSGGAFTLAFFDATLYDRRSLGGSLRQAKNFLVAYAALKQSRLGAKARLTGANLRAAWAFTLWGDPTLRLPVPEPPPDALLPGSHEVQGNAIVLGRPEQLYPKVTTENYQAQMGPNDRLAGLVTEAEEDTRRLVPMLFAEVKLKPPAPGQAPRLSSKVNSRSWTFLWDSRLGRGYLLVIPPAREPGELRFTIHWDD